MWKWNWRAGAGAAAMVLSACGSGGGDGTNADAAASTTAVATILDPEPAAPPITPSAGTIVLQGKVRFESVPLDASGSLDYSAQVLKPARSVKVELADVLGGSLASGFTDANGRYALTVPAGTLATVRVYSAMARNSGAPALPNVEVVDNTAQNALLGAESQLFTTGTLDRTFDPLLRSGWTSLGTLMAGTDRVAAPFAILDTIYEAQSKVLEAAPDTVFAPLAVQWSTSNVHSVRLNPASGEVQSTGFSVDGDKATIVLLGKADVDTDEYDASVIAHEWGHYLQHAFSRQDSAGGPHAGGDLLDRNVAFSEGFSTAFAGIALGRSRYADTFGPRQAEALLVDVATAPTVHKGWFNEDSVGNLMWRLNASSGFVPIFSALAGPLRTTVASTGIHSFNAALAQVAPVAAAAFAPLLASQDIAPGTDAWGTGETNGGGSTTALPLVHGLAAGRPGSTVCVSNALDTRREHNKLGDIAYLRFTLPVAGNYSLSVAGPSASDPDFRVTDASGVVLLSRTTAPGIERAAASLKAGNYLLAVDDFKLSSASTCFTVSLQ